MAIISSATGEAIPAGPRFQYRPWYQYFDASATEADVRLSRVFNLLVEMPQSQHREQAIEELRGLMTEAA